MSGRRLPLLPLVFPFQVVKKLEEQYGPDGRRWRLWVDKGRRNLQANKLVKNGSSPAGRFVLSRPGRALAPLDAAFINRLSGAPESR